MKKKIIGIILCTLMITTALTATGALNDQIKWSLKENNYSYSNQNSLADSHNFINISITAKVYNVNDPDNLLGGAIKVDDEITGKYTYDSLVEDSYPGTPDYSLYVMNFTPCVFRVKAGGLVFETNQTNPDNYNFYMQILNNYNYYGDVYYLLSYNNMPLSNGMTVRFIEWILEDQNGTALADDSLPTTAPKLSKWNTNKLGIYGYDPYNSMKTYTIYAHVTKATKSRSRDVYFTSQPILNWLFEHFSNIFPILQHLMKL